MVNTGDTIKYSTNRGTTRNLDWGRSSIACILTWFHLLQRLLIHHLHHFRPEKQIKTNVTIINCASPSKTLFLLSNSRFHSSVVWLLDQGPFLRWLLHDSWWVKHVVQIYWCVMKWLNRINCRCRKSIYLHVDNDSSVWADSGLIVATMTVLQFPPKLSLSEELK